MSREYLLDKSEDIKLLSEKIKIKSVINQRFKFIDEKIRELFFKEIGIDVAEFEKKYYYYNKERGLHISESEFGYTWISTIGLTTEGPELKEAKDKFYYAFDSQFHIIEIILDKIRKIVNDEITFDIDGYNFGFLNSINSGFVHNLVFYYELLAKTYLTIHGVVVNNIHSLEKLYKQVLIEMKKQKHCDSFFEYQIIPNILSLIEFISTIDGNFKEHYIKYNDNGDNVITLTYDRISDLVQIITQSYDAISMLYYEGESFYFKNGFKERLLNKAKNSTEKEMLKNNL